jgi:hypothetical protein
MLYAYLLQFLAFSSRKLLSASSSALSVLFLHLTVYLKKFFSHFCLSLSNHITQSLQSFLGICNQLRDFISFSQSLVYPVSPNPVLSYTFLKNVPLLRISSTDCVSLSHIGTGFNIVSYVSIFDIMLTVPNIKICYNFLKQFVS